MNDPSNPMSDDAMEMDRAMTLDGNAVAGLLAEIFGAEMTAMPSECAHCGNHAEVGSTRAFTQGPGITLRCSMCGEVMARIVQTPGATYMDLRGTAYLRIPRSSA